MFILVWLKRVRISEPPSKRIIEYQNIKELQKTVRLRI